MNEQMIKQIPNGEIIVLDHTTVHQNGLSIQEGLNKEQWIEGVIKPLKRLINTMQTSALWWWGDALAYGEKNYGSTYTKAIEESGYAYQSLAQAKAVSQRIPISSRYKNLTWSHHAEVAFAFDDSLDRATWLKRAETEGMTKSELRKAIRMSKAEYQDQPNEDAGQFNAINAAKTLCTYLEHQDVATWDTERRSLWITDLRPIALAYAQLVGSSTA
jgi:hypothetical protein